MRRSMMTRGSWPTSLLLVAGATVALGSVPDRETLDISPYYFGSPSARDHGGGSILEGAAEYDRTDWRALIDAAWGPSPLSPSERRQFYDLFWTALDERFACFQDLGVDWDDVYARYDPEIEVPDLSRGRFSAIMTHMAMALMESHTRPLDMAIAGTYPTPGTPLLISGGWGNNRHFGAGLTPLPDSTLLVYTAVPDHPLGLVPGDIVLGYDGALWKDLYPQLLAAELPVTAWWWGSCHASFRHSFLMSAGMNWHLFETLDVIKYDTGQTLHLAVAPLVEQSVDLFCSEQLDIAGVPKPIPGSEWVSWGIVDGTDIGYIYVWGWMDDAGIRFGDAIQALMDSTSGLIIDFRMNYGGDMFLSNDGLELLFDQYVRTIGMAIRCGPTDHEAMCMTPDGHWSGYVIDGDPATFYDRPIAVLTGPGAVSAGDQVALRMTYHPMVRTFGKSTSTAYNAPQALQPPPPPDWSVNFAVYDAYFGAVTSNCLTHDEFVVDEPVWLSPVGVANGMDSVVATAIAWITGTTGAPTGVVPGHVVLRQNTPNPFNPSTRIEFMVPAAERVRLSVYDTAGRLVRRLVDGVAPAGVNTIVWSGADMRERPVGSGVYVYRLEYGQQLQTRRMVLMR